MQEKSNFKVSSRVREKNLNAQIQKICSMEFYFVFDSILYSLMLEEKFENLSKIFDSMAQDSLENFKALERCAISKICIGETYFISGNKGLNGAKKGFESILKDTVQYTDITVKTAENARKQTSDKKLQQVLDKIVISKSEYIKFLNSLIKS